MATLKISDLSVGDWVKCAQRNGSIQRIAMHDGETVEVIIEADCGRLYMYKRVYEIDPIPITAEMLENNGFVRGQRGNFYHYLRLDKNRTLYIHASTNGWRVEITYDAAGILRTTHLMPDVNSVHDLQHALRLAGVDKEINL